VIVDTIGDIADTFGDFADAIGGKFVVDVVKIRFRRIDADVLRREKKRRVSRRKGDGFDRKFPPKSPEIEENEISEIGKIRSDFVPPTPLPTSANRAIDPAKSDFNDVDDEFATDRVGKVAKSVGNIADCVDDHFRVFRLDRIYSQFDKW
jgi:hypothetical protein